MLHCVRSVLNSSYAGWVARANVCLCRDKKLMADYASSMRSKTGMKTLFGRKNIKKDNTEGKVSNLCLALDIEIRE